MEITRGRNFALLFFSQEKYIKKTLRHFNMHDAVSISTIVASHFKLSSLQCPIVRMRIFEYMSRVPYSSVVVSLMYVMVCSCSDLSYSMSFFSRHMANPIIEYWKTIKWIFRYLRGTSNAWLKFGNVDE